MLEALKSCSPETVTDMLKSSIDEASHTIDKFLEASTKSVPMPLFGFEELQEGEKGAYFDDILQFLGPFLRELTENPLSQDRGLVGVLARLKEHIRNNSQQKNKLLKLMNIDKLIIPYISLALPGDIILAYNKLEERDPLVSLFRLHPVIGNEVYKFGVFLDRYDTNKEAICSLVWSTIDNMMICLPMIGLNPYPTCWYCEASFGTLTCSCCGVAKYCSKECQVASWKASHRMWCKEISTFATQHQRLVFTADDD